MQINSISYQTFEWNFRLPVKNLQTKWGMIPADCAKEYVNPRAKELYKKAQKATNLKDKA